LHYNLQTEEFDTSEDDFASFADNHLAIE